jgi:hypothetical protein
MVHELNLVKRVLACSALLGLGVPAVALGAQDATQYQQVAPPAPPQTKTVGGHVGAATPLVSVAKKTTNISDQFTLAHPIGVTVKLSDTVAADFEVVMANPIHPTGSTTLTVDPGVIVVTGPVALGLRLAWEVNARTNVGIIPLINKGLMTFGRATWFVEAAFPMSYRDVEGDKYVFNVVFHTGIGF